MIETKVLSIPVVLPQNGDCELCAARLGDRLLTHKGIEVAHVNADTGTLILHYDPNLITLPQVEQTAQLEGVEIGRRYRHDTLPLEGLDCADCAATLEKGVGQMRGVQSAAVNFAAAVMRVGYDADQVTRDEIAARIRELGYDVPSTGPAGLAFRLEGLDCADCAVKLEQMVGALDGVRDVRVNFGAARMTVAADDGGALLPLVVRRVAEAGYQAQPEGEPTAAEMKQAGLLPGIFKRRRDVLTLVSGLSIAVAFALSQSGLPQAYSIAFYFVAIVTGGYYVARSGWAALRTTRSLDMNFLMSTAAIGAMSIGEWAEGAMAMFLFSLGNTLEGYTMDRARDSIRKLMDLSPAQATVLRDGREVRAAVESLAVGDVIVVRPGEKIPMDGVIVRGASAVNQAPITGESTPVDKGVGDEVYAGTINASTGLGTSEQGALEINVTQRAEDNTLSRIVRMVEEAQAQKAPSQRFVDVFARYYTPAVVVGAVAVAVLPPLLFGAPFATWFRRALVLLVISCPCALVISTPVSIVSAISNAARNGVLIKGGAYLEEAGRLQVMAFDKTGTLTEGQPAVTDVIPLDSQSPQELLCLAASVEARSEHPLAQAIVHEARHQGLDCRPVADFQALPGRGASARLDGQTYYIGQQELIEECVAVPPQVVEWLKALEAEGKTAMLLGTGEALLGLIAVADQVRGDSRATVAELARAGIRRTVMLTGDNARTAAAIARQVGVDEYRAGLMPADKVRAIDELLETYGKVAMVGDGVNDAPALARATVGIAMGAAGTDAALETADIALMADDLCRLPYAMRLSRRAVGIIKQNIGFSLVIKALFVALAVPGLATLWMAVFADMGASLLVTLNGMRLLGYRDRAGCERESTIPGEV